MSLNVMVNESIKNYMWMVDFMHSRGNEVYIYFENQNCKNIVKKHLTKSKSLNVELKGDFGLLINSK